MIQTHPSIIKINYHKHPEKYIIEVCSQVNSLLKDKPSTTEYTSNIEIESAILKVAEKNKIALRKIQLSENWWQEDHGIIIGFTKNPLKPIGLLFKNDSYNQIENNIINPISDDPKDRDNILNYGFHIFKQIPDKNITFKSLSIYLLKEYPSTIALILCLGILTTGFWIAIPIIFHKLMSGLLQIPNYNWFTNAIFASLFYISFLSIKILYTLKSNTFIETCLSTLQTLIWSKIIKSNNPSLETDKTNQYKLLLLSNLKESISLTQLSNLFLNTLKISLLAVLFTLNPIIGFGLFCIQLIILISHLLLCKTYIKNPPSQKNTLNNAMNVLYQLDLLTSPKQSLYNAILTKQLNTIKKRTINTIKQLNKKLRLKHTHTTLLTAALPTTWLLLFTYQLIYTPTSLNTPLVLTSVLIISIITHANNAIINTSFSMLENSHNFLEINKTLNNYSTHYQFIPSEHAIEVKDLTYQIPNTQTSLFTNTSFSIPKNSLTVIQPSSNSGTSTLLKLLSNEARPQSGKITIDETLFKKDIFNPITILQSHSLLQTTLLENLIGKEPIDIAQVWKVLSQLDLESVIRKLPLGLLTPINYTETIFSNSQQKRLLLAYGVLHSSPILLIDNILTQTNMETHTKINYLLKESNKTILIISENKELITMADQVYSIKNRTLKNIVKSFQA